MRRISDLSSTKPEIEAKRILVVDDDADWCAYMQILLAKNGFIVQTATSGQKGLIEAQDFHPDLIIADISMPEMDGIEFCRHIRHSSGIPLIFLSVIQDETIILDGFQCGAIDFIVKPPNPLILLARVNVALRTSTLIAATTTIQPYDDGYLNINLMKRQVSIEGRPVHLTMTELSILIYLVERAGAQCSKEEILNSVWGDEYQDATSHIYTYIRRLRQKLERNPDDPEYILTVHGLGYRFK